MKKFALILLAGLLALCGCGGKGIVNGGARPNSSFGSLKEAFAYYEDASYLDGDTSCRFIRDLAGLCHAVCDIDDFADWEKSVDENAASYNRTLKLFGYDTAVSVGIKDNNDMVMAVAMSFTGGDRESDYAIARTLLETMYDYFGGSYEAQLDGERISDRKMQEALAAEDGSRTMTVIWPKSSVKWSLMIGFYAEGGETHVSIYIL